jgi:hypothetical protein
MASEEPKPVVALFSYFPLFNYNGLEPGSELAAEPDRLADLIETMLSAYDGHPVGIVWGLDTEDNIYTPIIIIPRAKELVDHMKEWSESKVGERFRVILSRLERGGYGLMVAPILHCSINRWISARFLYQEQLFPKDDHRFMVLFRPILATSESCEAFSHAEPHLGDSIRIGLCDANGFDRDKCLSGEGVGEVHWLDDLRLSRGGEKDKAFVDAMAAGSMVISATVEADFPE